MRYTYTSVESRHFGVPRYVCVAMVTIIIIEEAATLLQASFFRSLVVARGRWVDELVEFVEVGHFVLRRVEDVLSLPLMTVTLGLLTRSWDQLTHFFGMEQV